MSSITTAQPMADISVMGLGVMGENLALNLEDYGYRVGLWNHTEAKVTRLIQDAGANRQWIGTRTLEEFADALSRPRRILLMIKAGAPVDEMLEKLAPLLAPDDVIVDGGNSHFTETRRGEAALSAHGVHFIGMGASGGEETSHQKTKTITRSHGRADHIQKTYQRIHRFFDDLKANAPQLSDLEFWCRILSEAMTKYLGGRILKPPNQAVLTK